MNVWLLLKIWLSYYYLSIIYKIYKSAICHEILWMEESASKIANKLSFQRNSSLLSHWGAGSLQLSDKKVWKRAEKKILGRNESFRWLPKKKLLYTQPDDLAFDTTFPDFPSIPREFWRFVQLFLNRIDKNTCVASWIHKKWFVRSTSPDE